MTSERLKTWAQSIKRDVHAVYLASRDPRVPWYAKLFAVSIAAYALSPIDLIPDFIPIIGYLDDLLIVPVAIYLVIKLIPPEVMHEHRRAAEAAATRPKSLAGAVFIVMIWLLAVGAIGWVFYRRLA